MGGKLRGSSGQQKVQLEPWKIERVGMSAVLQAFHGGALVVLEMGMEVAFEDSVFLMAHYSYVGTLSGLEDKFLIERAADIAFQMETQKIANFLDGLESAGKTDGAFLSVFETTIGSEFVYLHVCDDVAYATSEEFGLAAVEDITIGHISEVEEPPLRVGDVNYKNLGVCGRMR